MSGTQSIKGNIVYMILYNYADGGELENEELNKIKKAYDFGSEYFDGKIYVEAIFSS